MKQLGERFGKDTVISQATIGQFPTANGSRSAFTECYDNGHTNEEGPNTCLLRINLTSSVLLHQGTRYEIDFVNWTA